VATIPINAREAWRQGGTALSFSLTVDGFHRQQAFIPHYFPRDARIALTFTVDSSVMHFAARRVCDAGARVHSHAFRPTRPNHTRPFGMPCLMRSALVTTGDDDSEGTLLKIDCGSLPDVQVPCQPYHFGALPSHP